MTPLRPMTHKRSALYMLAHDEWCSHDEADDGIECDCHLSVIASLRTRLEEWDDYCRAVMDEKCMLDQRHCTCVPALRKRLEAEERERKTYYDMGYKDGMEEAERYHDRYAQHIRSFVGKDHDDDARVAALAGRKP
jgi:hypothetical protein